MIPGGAAPRLDVAELQELPGFGLIRNLAIFDERGDIFTKNGLRQARLRRDAGACDTATEVPGTRISIYVAPENSTTW